MHPSHKVVFSSMGASLPGKTEHFKSSVFQKVYRCSALAVRAYQSELLKERVRKLDIGSPNPVLWEEKCRRHFGMSFWFGLLCRFIRGAHRLSPVSKPLVPPWDLSIVLDWLSKAPIEPIDSIFLKLLSFKIALLLALTMEKRWANYRLYKFTHHA